MSIELPYSLPCENVTPMVAVGLGLLRDPARPGAAGARPERDELDREVRAYRHAGAVHPAPMERRCPARQ